MHRSRRPLIAGNWKMHHGGASGVELAADVVRLASAAMHVDIVVAPPFTALAACAHECDGSRVEVGAQNVYPKDGGPFTGEISPRMLVDSGCKWVIVGHSERRQHFGETDAFVAQKVKAAMAAGLIPVVCVGETLEEREAGETVERVTTQVRAGLGGVTSEAVGGMVLAYEPVWAIGTGRTATPSDAQETCAVVRRVVAEVAGEAAASTVRIQYGGSVGS
ncbi:MAG: triose-phosphate isomerase, partial [Polyangiaceae bacterium]